MSVANQIYAAAFAVARQPRSAAYRAGVLSELRARLEGAPRHCPYAEGTAECDAWCAGTDEGARRANEYKQGAPA